MTHDVPPQLRYTFSIVANVPDESEFLPVEERSGDRILFIPILDGEVTGEIAGQIIPGGGDWCWFRADESFDVEARYLIRTTDDEVIDVVNVGVLRHLPGDRIGSEDFGYFITTPKFRTVSPRLQWLTRSMFVGRAISQPGKTTIHVFEVLE